MARLFDFRSKTWVGETSFTGDNPPETIVNTNVGIGGVPTETIYKWIRDSLNASSDRSRK